jgi:putative FmdB family regulatory protein
VPTYQYACTTCDERTEAVQKFTDDPLTVCEACGGHLRKVYSAVGIVFKGSGFYRTDSRNGSVQAEAKDGAAKDKQAGSGDGSSGKGEAPAAGSGSSPGEKPGSGETKPAKKTEKAGSGTGTGSKVA